MCEAVVFDWQIAEGVPSVASICMLLATDPAGLSRADAVAAAVGVERAKRLLDAVGVRMQARAAGSAPSAGDVDETAQELSCALGLEPSAAVAQVEHARNLVRRLPVTMKALEAGQLTLRQAQHVDTVTGPLDVSDAQEVEAAAVPGSPRRLNERLRRVIARIAPEHARRSAQLQRSERTVLFWSDRLEGISGAHVQGPADKVAIIKAAIDAEARQRIAGDCRPIAARRFDVLHSWARQALGLDQPDTHDQPTGTATEQSVGDRRIRGTRSCGSCGRSGPTKIPINVTVSLAALAGLSEQPADLNGTPIPAAAARELAADGEWRRWILDPGTGQLLDIGATTYRPSAALARHIRGRDRTCRFPSCTRPAVDCHADHIVAFHTEGGHTTRANLGNLCQHHHRLKHETDWTYTLHPDGTTIWTAPSGRTYPTPAEHHGNPDDHNAAPDSDVAEPDELADDPALSQLFTRTHTRQRQREQRQQQQAEQRQAVRDRRPNPDPWVLPTDADMKEPPPF